MSISNVSGGNKMAALIAMQQSLNGLGSTGVQDSPLMQLLGGGGSGGGVDAISGGVQQLMAMLGGQSPLAQLLQGSAGGAEGSASSDALQMLQSVQGQEDDGDDGDLA